eukprot:gene43224-57523_t
MAVHITPVVKSSLRKVIYAHEISVSISGLSSNSLPLVRGQYITQPLVDWNGNQFSMRIYRMGMDESSRGRFSFSFHVAPINYKVPLVVSFSVNLQGDLTPNYSSSVQKISRSISIPAFTFSSTTACASYPTDIAMDNGCQLNDITFVITLSIQLQEPHDHSLSSDLAALLESAEEESPSSQSAADIVIIADEGTVRLPAMKTLLCARSAVFKAMLLSGSGGSGMSESLSKEIIIPDFDSG